MTRQTSSGRKTPTTKKLGAKRLGAKKVGTNISKAEVHVGFGSWTFHGALTCRVSELDPPRSPLPLLLSLFLRTPTVFLIEEFSSTLLDAMAVMTGEWMNGSLSYGTIGDRRLRPRWCFQNTVYGLYNYTKPNQKRIARGEVGGGGVRGGCW